jgi:UDPglucose 6-dehydrogenase
MLKIVVVGLGYVGLANAIFLSHHHEVIGYDTDQAKLNKIAQGTCPIEDQSIRDHFANSKVNVKIVTDPCEAYRHADVVIIATPTDYDEASNRLDTSIVVKTVARVLELNRQCVIIIRSTLPLGTIDKLTLAFDYENIMFVPEFLREGLALSDTNNPTRLVIGSNSVKKELAADLLSANLKTPVPIIYTTPTEAEAIKLFSNAYLALRIAFFNELDNLAIEKHLDAKTMITALGHDSRIGNTYNNPSFGFSGYCLPKDTKQLVADFDTIPHSIVEAIGKSNEQRIDFVVSDILSLNPKTIGIYRLTMKQASSNLRHAVIHEVIRKLREHRIDILIYEPLLKNSGSYEGCMVGTIDELIDKSDVIVANRSDELIARAGPKLYTRDAFHTDK